MFLSLFQTYYNNVMVSCKIGVRTINIVFHRSGFQYIAECLLKIKFLKKILLLIIAIFIRWNDLVRRNDLWAVYLVVTFFFAEVCDHYLIEMADTILNRLLKKQEASFNKEDTWVSSSWDVWFLLVIGFRKVSVVNHILETKTT